MTSVIAWISPGPGPDETSVLAVSDTRVSDGRAVLLDDVAKISALPVRCSWAEGIYHNHTVGYAFAGSTLIGLNTFAHLTECCVSLMGLNTGAVPGLEHLAQLAAEILASQSQEYRGNHGTEIACSALLFGYCHVANRPRIFRIEADLFGEADTSDPAQFQILGRHQQEIAQRIHHERARHVADAEGWLRAPETVIRQVVDSRDYEGIGGGLKLAVANSRGVQLFSSLSPILSGDYRGVLGNGFYGSVFHVGPCMLARGVLPTKKDPAV